MSRNDYINSNFNDLFRVWSSRACLFGALMFIILSFMDYVVAPEHFSAFLTYRITASLLLIAIYPLLRKLNSINWLYVSAYVAIALSAITIEMMILALGGHTSPYYVGMILLAICAVALIPARPRFHLGSLIIIYSIYALPILIGERITNFPAFFMANSFMITCFSAAFVPSYFIAIHHKRNYGLQYDLDEERKRSERRLSENLPGIVYRLHLTGKKGMQFFNDMLEPVTGYAEDELGKGAINYIDSLIVSDDHERVVRQVKTAVLEKKPFEVEYRIQHKNGGIRHCLERGRPVMGEDGKALYIDGIILDITDRKQVEEDLYTSKERYQMIVEGIKEIIYMVSIEDDLFTGKLEFVSSHVEEILGYTPDEFMTDHELWFSLIHPDDKTALSDTTRDIASKRITLTREYRIRHKHSGEYRWLEDKVRPLTDEAGNTVAFFGAARDTTDRKRAEMELKVSEERYRRLVESEHDVILLYDAESLRIEDVNSAASKLFGYTKEEFLSMTTIDLSGEKELTMENMEKFKNTDVAKIEVTRRKHVRKDGTTFYGDIRAASFYSKGRKKVIGAMRDVTARIQADEEKKELERMYHQAQKLEALGEMSRGISHDFNNILAIILNNLELARMQGLQSISGYIDKALDAVNRGKGLVGNLMSFSKGMVVEPDVVNLGEITEGTINFMEKASGGDSTVEVSVSPGLWNVYGNPSQMQQVVMNLYQNAREATRERSDDSKPHISFKVDNVVVKRAMSGGSAGVNGEEFVRLSVSDNGCGMDDDTQSRIFEPFFSTKGANNRGVGLSAVYGIIKRNGGWVDVESTLGAGSVFNIYLPRYVGEGAKRTHLLEKQIVGGSEAVMVVDDEKSLADSTREMLETLGYRVNVAYSGADAIRIYKEKSKEIDLILMDLVMPDISGIELIKKFRAINPGSRIIIASGNIDEINHKQELDVSCLAKPYNLEALSSAVRQVLGDSAGESGIKRHLQRVKLYSVKEEAIPHKENITSAASIYRLFKHIAHDSREKFIAVFLDMQKRIIAYDELTQGTYNEVVVHSQEVMRSALLTNAAGVILVHNHPSGEVEPSIHDIELTSRMVDSCKMFNIEFLDHIIIGKDGYFSFSKEESTLL